MNSKLTLVRHRRPPFIIFEVEILHISLESLPVTGRGSKKIFTRCSGLKNAGNFDAIETGSFIEIQTTCFHSIEAQNDA